MTEGKSFRAVLKFLARNLANPIPFCRNLIRILFMSASRDLLASFARDLCLFYQKPQITKAVVLFGFSQCVIASSRELFMLQHMNVAVILLF